MNFTADLRYAFRMLRVNPGFAAVAIITLALGIGATTAMFTVVNGVVLKSLRYPDAARIVAVNTKFTDKGNAIWRLTGGDLEDLRADKDSFEAFSFYNGGEMGVQLARSAEFVPAFLVDPEFFHVFTTSPLAGRTFVNDDAGRAALVSRVLPSATSVQRRPRLDRRLASTRSGTRSSALCPGSSSFQRRRKYGRPYRRSRKPQPQFVQLSCGRETQRGCIAGDRQRARASDWQPPRRRIPERQSRKTFILQSLQEQLAAPVRSTLFMLMGAVGLVLLIACANVANLMLARATARSRELAMRAALGAGRGALISQLLAESFVLAVVAGVVGIGLAAWGTKALLGIGARFVPATLLGGIHLDWRVLAFALAASLLTSVLFGIAPACTPPASTCRARSSREVRVA